MELGTGGRGLSLVNIAAGLPNAMNKLGDTSLRVEEMQGLYGPFTFSEKLLQQIWARGDFDHSNLTANDGRRLQVVQPGRWNLLGGPDFKDARLKFDDGPVITGDVELHLCADDWAAHGHAADPAYDNVRLHVVLFPAGAEQATAGGQGRSVPTVVLLPCLHHGLEEYAAEAAIEGLAGRPLNRLMELLRQLPTAELVAELHACAEARWRQKVHFARLRIGRLGWDDACHHAALEILGYRFNRASMLRVAAQFPLPAWAGGEVDLDQIHASEAGRWSMQGVRPANHPKTRLRQYGAWIAATSDWPAQLAASVTTLPTLPMVAPTGEVRRKHWLGALRTAWASQLCAGAVGGTRLDNLVCDGWLPMLSARTGKDLAGLWHHWFPGDQPPVMIKALRELGLFDGRSNPACQGAMQGLMGRWLATGTQ